MKPRPRKRRLRRALLVACALSVLYVGSYAALSAAGDYNASQTGRLRYFGGLSVTDVYHWQPKLAYWEPFHDVYGRDTSRGDLPGYFYSPLIRLDRARWHPSHYLFDDAPPTVQSKGEKASAKARRREGSHEG
jgi:hypothetical protein